MTNGENKMNGKKITVSKWEYTEAELWRYGENDISIYHVFGTIAIKNTVLVFAEARYGDGSDADSVHDIVMRKSTDGGKSFLDEVKVLPSDGKHCWVNPVPLYDTETERLFLFYAENLGNTKTENHIMYSDDLGESWSSPKNVTEILQTHFSLPGPGHGIRLNNGVHSGRLLMQFWHRDKGVEVPSEERDYRISYLYSDDHGESWKHSPYYGRELLSNESRFVECKDSILWSIRTRDKYQGVARSYDGGDSFTEFERSPLPEAKNCDIGVISVRGKEEYENMVLMSRVSHLDKRRDMEIRISCDGGKSFPDAFALMQGDAMPGYSDMCIIDEGEPVVGLLHCRNNHVLFSRISLQTLTGGRYDNTSRSVWLK